MGYLSQKDRVYTLRSDDYDIGGTNTARILSEANARNGAEAYFIEIEPTGDFSRYGMSDSVSELIVSRRHKGVGFNDIQKDGRIFVNVFSIRTGLFGRRLSTAGRANHIAIAILSTVD